jgi:hypothetical protein
LTNRPGDGNLFRFAYLKVERLIVILTNATLFLLGLIGLLLGSREHWRTAEQRS